VDNATSQYRLVASAAAVAASADQKPPAETAERRAVLHAVNPDAPDSPMAIMKQTLTTLLSEHSRSQAEALKQQQERQERFEMELREAVARMESKRAHDQKSPRGGFDFEDAVAEFVIAAVRGAPCVAEVTGNTAGLRNRCKKGDLVIRFTQESAFDGAGVVFEAKRDASYTAQKALAELDTARANRNAVAGVFVMARSHATEGFPTFARFGSNVLVVWDETDATSDPYLHAAILLGLGLSTRGKTVGDQGDLEALRDVEGRIEDELRRLGKMEKHNEGIRKNSDGMADEIRKAERQLDLLLRKAKSTLLALRPINWCALSQNQEIFDNFAIDHDFRKTTGNDFRPAVCRLLERHLLPFRQAAKKSHLDRVDLTYGQVGTAQGRRSSDGAAAPGQIDLDPILAARAQAPARLRLFLSLSNHLAPPSLTFPGILRPWIVLARFK
jgi:hypothetical protein